MGIAGITVGRNTPPLFSNRISAMLSALKMGEPFSSFAERELLTQLGAGSHTGTASVWSTNELIVACDAELVGTDDAAEAAEVIGKLYSRFGRECLTRLRGAFALAIWDKLSQTMLIAIDRFAARPLSYFADEKQLVFASQPRGIFFSGEVEKNIDPQAVVDFLNFSAVPAPHSAFTHIQKLPGGCYLEWKNGSYHVGLYWDLVYSEADRSSTSALSRELLERMADAVRVHSEDCAGQHLGCFLSGGTDSSSILALLSRQQGAPVNAFSIGFSEERFNELEYARTAANAFKAAHHIAVLTPEEVFRDIQKIASAYDEPFGNASVLPTYACLKLARQHGIEVMLAGDGGDELFGGNERYRTEQIFDLYKKVPEPLRHHFVEPLARNLPGSGIVGKARRYIAQAYKPHPERYFQWYLLQKFSPEKILSDAAAHKRDLLQVPRQHYNNAQAHSELNRLLYIDIKMTLGDNDLPKVARAAELAGVNVRFPLLDAPLADFSGRLPAHLKVRRLKKRYLFKKATAGLLPEAILRKKKHGFGLPIGLWLKEHPLWRGLAEDVLLDSQTYQRGYFQRSFVEDLFRWMDADNSTYYGDLLWLFLMCELWHRQHAFQEVAA